MKSKLKGFLLTASFIITFFGALLTMLSTKDDSTGAITIRLIAVVVMIGILYIVSKKFYHNREWKFKEDNL